MINWNYLLEQNNPPTPLHQKPKQLLIRRQTSVTETVFSGPVPPPELLAEYAKILPSAPERILAMAERQGLHRQRSETRGQWFGFFLAATALVGGLALLITDRKVEGFGTLVTAVFTFAGLHIYNRHQAKKLSSAQTDSPN